MTALGKHIIPLQKEDLKLAFNIQSYDTIKYNPKNIATELDRAIKDAIKITESRDKEDKKTGIFPEKSILRSFELSEAVQQSKIGLKRKVYSALNPKRKEIFGVKINCETASSGFKLREENWFLSDVINDTEFRGFGQYDKGFYAYLGKLDDQEEMQTYLDDLNIVLYRTEKKFEELTREIQENEKGIVDLESDDTQETERFFSDSRGRLYHDDRLNEDLKDKKEREALMRHMYIGFIINPKIDGSNFIKKVESMVSKYHRFSLTYNKNSEILFGDIKVKLDYSKHSL
jgi:hypothetical protein